MDLEGKEGSERDAVLNELLGGVAVPLDAAEAARGLLPSESLAFTVALAQCQRGEEPTPNVATVCVLALGRLTGRFDWMEGFRG